MFGVSVDTIRYYNKIGLLSAERDTSNNYLFFTLQSVSNLYSVLLLRSMGLSITDINKFFQCSDIQFLSAELFNTYGKLQDQIKNLQTKQKMITEFLSKLDTISTVPSTVQIRESPEWLSISADNELDIVKLVADFRKLSSNSRCNPSYAFIMSRESFVSGRFEYSKYGLLSDPECTPSAYPSVFIKPHQCAYYFSVDTQEKPDAAYNLLHAWIIENNYLVTGDIIERFLLRGTSCIMMEIWVPVDKKPPGDH